MVQRCANRSPPTAAAESTPGGGERPRCASKWDLSRSFLPLVPGPRVDAVVAPGPPGLPPKGQAGTFPGQLLSMTQVTGFCKQQEEDFLKHLPMKIKDYSSQYGLQLNEKKTKILKTGPIDNIMITGEKIDIVIDLILLGSTINVDRC